MATLSQFGIPEAGVGILHPKQKNRWQVKFIGIAKEGTAKGQDLTRQAVTINRPNLAFEDVPIHRYNTTSYVAGKHTWEMLNLSVEDDVGGLASRVIQQQVEAQQQIIGMGSGEWLNAASTASNYKFGIILEQLDGNEGVLESWKCEGCYINSVNWGDLDYSGSEAVVIELQIRFDHARQELGGEGYGTALEGFLA